MSSRAATPPWFDGMMTGPYRRAGAMKGWLPDRVVGRARPIADMICPACDDHVVGQVVDTDQGPLLVLYAPQPRRQRPRGPTPPPTTDRGNRVNEFLVEAAATHDRVHLDGLDDALVLRDRRDGSFTAVVEDGLVEVGTDAPHWHLRRDDGSDLFIDRRTGATIVRNADGTFGDRRPDISFARYRLVDPPGTVPGDVLGRLEDDEQCTAVCNHRAAHHHVLFAGTDVHHAIEGFRATGRRQRVLGTADRAGGSTSSAQRTR